MGDLYASAIGVTTLQLKEIPQRPAEYDGLVCLFDLVEGVDKVAIRKALKQFGEPCNISINMPSVTVRFATHKAACAAKRGAVLLTSICGGIDTLYNERSYDGRRNESGRDDDDGRGW